MYIDAKQLYERGWTETMIKRFLVHPDRRTPVDHWLNYEGKRCYFLGRVEIVEAGSDFIEAFRKSARRRNLSDDTIARIVRKRRSTNGQVRRYAESLTDEDIKLLSVIHKMAEIMRDARNHGYRTPHKC